MGEGVKAIESVRAARAARVLWVDDNPDNNGHETVALEDLGLFVTKATSTAAALVYASYLSFDLVITDKGRRGNHDAGLELLRALGSRNLQWPVIVYTVNAAAHRDEMVAGGAAAVVDTPSELMKAVMSIRP